MSSSFFEIGGHVIESIVDSPTPRPRSDPVEHFLKTEYNVPKTMTKSAAKTASSDDYDFQRTLKGAGRARRAQWAFTTAATLALADGPLPVGDALAIGLLVGYGSLEFYYAVGDMVQN
jgi:hypothetical protein